jgi:hypothetical protein
VDSGCFERLFGIAAGLVATALAAVVVLLV